MNWIQKLSIPFLVIGIMTLFGNAIGGTIHLGGAWYSMLVYIISSNIFLIVGIILLAVGCNRKK